MPNQCHRPWPGAPPPRTGLSGQHRAGPPSIRPRAPPGAPTPIPLDRTPPGSPAPPHPQVNTCKSLFLLLLRICASQKAGREGGVWSMSSPGDGVRFLKMLPPANTNPARRLGSPAPTPAPITQGQGLCCAQGLAVMSKRELIARKVRAPKRPKGEWLGMKPGMGEQKEGRCACRPLQAESQQGWRRGGHSIFYAHSALQFTDRCTRTISCGSHNEPLKYLLLCPHYKAECGRGYCLNYKVRTRINPEFPVSKLRLLPF